MPFASFKLQPFFPFFFISVIFCFLWASTESWFCWRTLHIISITNSFRTSSSFVIFIIWDIYDACHGTFCVQAHKNPSHQLPQSAICCRCSKWCMWCQGGEKMAKAARDKPRARSSIHLVLPSLWASLSFLGWVQRHFRIKHSSLLVPFPRWTGWMQSSWNWGLEHVVQWQLSNEMCVVAGLSLLNNCSSQRVIKCQSSWLFYKLIATINVVREWVFSAQLQRGKAKLIWEVAHVYWY